MMRPRVLILQATGTNRDGETAATIEAAGGQPEIVHVNTLRERPGTLDDYQMLVIPGGFSYGDALGAGRLLASDLRWLFHDQLARFVAAGKPVLGICNGFQALVKTGWLPGPPETGIQATLTRNHSNRFECRWVLLEPDPASPCVFTRGLSEPISCPVAHGEGRFVPADGAMLEQLQLEHRVALRYLGENGGPAGYPANPNGSTADIAGICNAQGNVLGLMPHPEDHSWGWQHPRGPKPWPGTNCPGLHGRPRGGLGLSLFENGIRYASES